MIGKALVKKTGEVLEIKTHYFTKQMTLNIDLPDGIDIPDEWKEKFSYEKETIPAGDHYILSDGNQYDSEELIVGIDSIRDYKISNQIKIDE